MDSISNGYFHVAVIHISMKKRKKNRNEKLRRKIDPHFG